jgi:DNA invertase Pin-like site-specific DNA recombinase
MSQLLTTPERRASVPSSGETPEKVRPWHRDRLAVVYVRQSTPQQVLVHQESTRLQYGLADRARALGWATERVLVIDDDLGKSGTNVDDRLGFQRLVSEVSLDHVGLILGLEMSRLARSNRDWHQLLELCAVFRTLIADLDGVYDPAQYNDRLLLGLKGTLSEAELHVLKQRMYQGRLSKARRGELSFPLPTGYVWRDGAIVLDPDEQVQTVVRLVFQKFTELGTLGGVLRYLAQSEVQFGIRVREGPGKGQLVWRRPNRPTLQQILKHLLYAGTYVYGRRQNDPRHRQAGRPRSGRVVMAPSEWLAHVPEHCPAYITREQYEANLARLEANRARAESLGTVRAGPALLAGLVMCAQCRVRLSVRYHGAGQPHLYECTRARNNYGGALCQHVAGPCLDRFVEQQVLLALEPAALELALEATTRLEHEREDVDRLWQQRRERAAYDAERAARQYHVVEPENRLVARTLEHAWEAQLAAQQHLEEAYHRFLHRQPRILSADERAAIRRLAADIPALWDAPTTTPADRKEIVRQVVEHIVVDAQGRSERVRVAIAWIGGGHTDGEVIRPIARLADLSSYPDLCRRLHELTDLGLSVEAIGERLTAEGFRSARDATGFGASWVRALLQRLGLSTGRPRAVRRDGLERNEWWCSELALALGIPPGTLTAWIGRDWVRARRRADDPLRRWILWADEAECERLRQLHRRAVGNEARHRWTDAPSREARHD